MENEEKICGIYKITSPSGKIYIGQSENIYKRWRKAYKTIQCKFQKSIYNSLIKYGVDAHSFDIIHRCNVEDLNKWETYYSDLFKTFNTPHGMNLRAPGNASRGFSDETRKRMSIAGSAKFFTAEHKKNMSISAKKKIVTQETKKRISESKKGPKHPLFGKNRPIDANLKTSKTLVGMFAGDKNGMFGKAPWNKGKTGVYSEDVLKKNRESNSKGRHPKAKLVLNTENGVFYDCVIEAWESFRIKSYTTFKSKLNALTKNTTAFIYA